MVLLMLKRIGYFIVDNWRVSLSVVAAIILGLFILSSYRSCQRTKMEQSRQEARDALTKSVVATERAEALEESIGATRTEVEQAKEEAVKAQKEFVEKAGDAVEATTYSEARAKYCEAFPEDCK